MSGGQIARYWEAVPNRETLCLLCPHRCILSPSQRGFCGVRRNADGILMADSYGVISCLALDPIEKKPLRHFYPGTTILSFGSYGCNFKCQHCQNYDISQYGPCSASSSSFDEVSTWTAEQLVEKALSLENCIGIAATYNEPTIQIEFVSTVFKYAKDNGLKTVMISNGYIEEAPLKELLAVTDAFNIDLKGFTETFYSEICQGDLASIKRTLEIISSDTSTHLEVTCLLIPGINDDPEILEAQFNFIGQLSRKIPVHISRYFPRHHMTIRETPLERLQLAYEIAKRYLDDVYIGNV